MPTPLALPISSSAALGLGLTALMMVLTPGPNMMYLASRAIGQGRRAGFVSLAGTVTGFLVYLLLASVGLGVVFVAVPWLFIGLKAAGVAYLGWLAVNALRPGGTGVFEARELPADSPARLYRMGLVTNLLNPKIAIIYLTVIPQFVDPHRGHALLQSVVLSLEQITVSTAVNAGVVLAAGAIAGHLASRPAAVAWQRRITGTMLGVVTLMLAREVPARAGG